MPVKKAKDFRGMSDKELAAHISSLRKELFDLRLKHGSGALENNQQLRLVRKELARALTVQGEGVVPVVAASEDK
ncbi:MAG: 50S ribosomal protein L29 [Akkermansiaceae bacterium]|nr:50S ribosomal protein L29 [Akkermansiaceae bacterium]